MSQEPEIEVRKLGIVMAGKSLLVIDDGEQPPRCEQWGNYRVYFPDEIKSIDVSKLEPLP